MWGKVEVRTHEAGTVMLRELKLFWQSNFSGWLGILLFVGLLSAFAWMIGWFEAKNFAMLLLVAGAVWNLCVAVLFPVVELLVWLGWYKRDTAEHKGATGVHPNSSLSLLLGVTSYGAAAFVPSIFLQFPAFVLIGKYTAHGAILIEYAIIWTLILSIVFGIICVNIAWVSVKPQMSDNNCNMD